MSGWQAIAYVLRNFWLWPLQFWLRPLDVGERMRETDQATAELCSALLGCALWGAIFGTGVWLWNGEIQAIWQLALAFSLTVVSAYSCSGLFAGAAGTGARASAIASFCASASAAAGVGVVAVVGTGSFTGVVAGASALNNNGSYVGVGIGSGISTGLFYAILATIGLMVDLWLPSMITIFGTITGLFLLCLAAWIILSESKFNVSFPDWAKKTFVLIWLMILPCIGFAFFSTTPNSQISIWGFSLVFSISIGIQIGLYFSRDALWSIVQKVNLKGITHIASNWLALLYMLFGLLTLVTGWFDPNTSELNAKLNELALYFAVAAPIATGLPFWPLLCLMAAWRFRSDRVQRHNQQAFVTSLPFQWQTFAYPLPGLRGYLTSLGRLHSAECAFNAIQAVQLRSLQMRAARLAAKDLASDPGTALGFCGHVAVTCNNATLLPLGTTGPLARAVAVLAKPMDKEAEQALRLYVADYPTAALNLKRWYFSLAATPQTDWHDELKSIRWRDEFKWIRNNSLTKRLAYALRLLSDFPSAADAQDFSALLQTLSAYAEQDLRDVQNLPPTRQTKDHAPWLSQGWTVLAKLETLLQPLTIYRELATPSARRELLESKVAELQAVTWEGVSDYWAAIGQELLVLWIDKLQQEARFAREWLRLEAQLGNDRQGLGVQTLQLQVRNPTRVLARNVRFQVEATEGLDWHHDEAKQPLLEGGATIIIRLELEANRTGSFRVAGQLQAEDVSGNAYSLPLVFQIHVAEAGRAYRLLDYQPYVTGEGLGDERTFVGRHELLHWLRGLWLQPQGKPAVALVGQRRMGKTSLLNKIRRDGLPDTGLLPVLVNIQGVSGDYDFLHSVAREMAAHLSVPQPALHRDNPYPDFKDFLLGLTKPLQGRRFVLLLDEADLIPQRHFSDLLPGFLRALMQEPQYPALLLFCGTHRLKDMSRDYASILFNTVQFRPVSYMTEAEAAEVLSKPPGDALEFDPAVLAEAYRLTLGQPLLLQSLGAALIDCCNGVVLNGGERSNYINLTDLNLAADTLVQQGNAAFEQYWQDADADTHRLLSALAWATDETNRTQLDLAGIEAFLEQLGLALPEGSAFKIVERLCDEELLRRKGPTYHYAVPLYRRWVAWRWPPERVREE